MQAGGRTNYSLTHRPFINLDCARRSPLHKKGIGISANVTLFARFAVSFDGMSTVGQPPTGSPAFSFSFRTSPLRTSHASVSMKKFRDKCACFSAGQTRIEP